MREPAVSAIVLTYNQARYVESCLESLAAQTSDEWELIIADDGSTDEAPAVARAWAARHGVPIRQVLHERNRGLCSTLNDALALASGRYVAIIAADDHWLPEKFERQVAMLDERPDAAVVYSDMAYMDDDGVRDTKRVWRTGGASGRLFEQLLSGTVIGMATTLVRRDSLEAAGGFDEDLVFEDWDVWLRLADRSPFLFSPYVSAVYRERPDSMSAGSTFRVDILRSSATLLKKWRGRSKADDRVIAESLSKIGWRLSEHSSVEARRLLWESVLLAPSRVRLTRLVRVVLKPPRSRAGTHNR